MSNGDAVHGDDLGSISILLHQFHEEGDEQALDQVIQWYVEHHLRDLEGIAARRLERPARRVHDGEDVAASALKSFVRGARDQRFPGVKRRNDLAKLLTRITVNKALDRNQHERRVKRGGGKVVGESGLDAGRECGTSALEQILTDHREPQFIAMLAEQWQCLMDRLPDDKSREVARLRILGHKVREISERLEIAQRTVHFKLDLARKIWLAYEQQDDGR